MSRLEHHFGILDAAERSEGEERLIFQPLLFAIKRFKQPLAADGAGGAAMPATEVVFGQGFSADSLGLVKGRLLKIARRQATEAIEDREVGDSADASVLVGERTETALPQ